MKILYITVVIIISLFIINGCNKEKGDEYKPVIASNMQTDTFISVEDVQGNSIVSDKLFLEKISIYGVFSKQIKSFSLEDINGIKVIRFNVDAPNENNMGQQIVNPDKSSESYGKSIVNLYVDNQSLEVLYNLKKRIEPYVNTAKEPVFGGTSLYIQSAEINGKVIEKQGDYLIIPLLYSNGKLILKE